MVSRDRIGILGATIMRKMTDRIMNQIVLTVETTCLLLGVVKHRLIEMVNVTNR